MSGLAWIWDLLLPRRCLNCETDLREGVLCGTCRADIQIHATLFCGKCRARLAENRRICHPTHPYLLGSATDYQNPAVSELIRGLKFEGIEEAAGELAGFLIRYFENISLPTGSDLVIPVPLARGRLKERGYNQAELIARRFAENFGLPYEPALLRRIRETTAQSELSGEERARNVEDCFRAEPISARRVILVDDVTTSGSTLRAAALALHRAGAHQVLALTVAKA